MTREEEAVHYTLKRLQVRAEQLAAQECHAEQTLADLRRDRAVVHDLLTALKAGDRGVMRKLAENGWIMLMINRGPRERGACRVCGRVSALSATTGRVIAHNSKDGSHSCAGSGNLPRAVRKGKNT